MGLAMRPAKMMLSLYNTEIVETFPTIYERIRQHPDADAIMLMLQNLNYKRSYGIFLSDLTHFFLVNITTIRNKHINYRSFNGSSEPMYNNIHKKIHRSSSPLSTYIRDCLYKDSDIIPYSLECGNGISATLGNIASFFASLMIEIITNIGDLLAAFHEDFPFPYLATIFLTNYIE